MTTKPSVPELLAPAGSPEALQAAVQSGAGAVYLGCGSFNARRSAKNFSPEEFAEAVRYCHVRGVKVYLTLNTLVTDRELPAALETARLACRAGTDAILVQDWGLFAALRAALPDQPLHASTQMSLFTSGGAQLAAQAGCTRVVVARELSGAEVAEICQACPVEVETFVHGALCMGYSGQCAMSAVLGGRSGNRGTCAQPCRLPYQVEWEGDAAPTGHPLSLKDNCLAPRLQEMARAGVACLKIEGRMKRPEYVAVVTSIYARLLREGRGPTAEEMADLTAAFSRSGFTDGYWQGKRGPEMFGTRPENAPEPRELFARARNGYDHGEHGENPVDFHLVLRRGAAACLTGRCRRTDGAWSEALAQGAVPEEARNRAVTAEELKERLGKTGGTPFACRDAQVEVDEGLAFPAAALNALRRQVLAQLEEELSAPLPRRDLPAPQAEDVANDGAWDQAPGLTCSLFWGSQLTEELLSQDPERVYLPLERLEEFPWQSHLGRTQFWAVVPRVWRDKDEPALRRRLEEAREAGLSGVLIGNLGHLSLVEGLGLPLAGDYGLNLFNSLSLNWARDQGLSSATVSFELRRAQIRDLRKPLAAEAIVYGRLPLQITENCPAGNAGDCRGKKQLCRHGACLKDRTGARFPLLPAFGCRCEIQNSRPLYLADREDWKNLGLRYARLRFTDESPQACAEVFRAYAQGGGEPPELFTRGLFDKGVE